MRNISGIEDCVSGPLSLPQRSARTTPENWAFYCGTSGFFQILHDLSVEDHFRLYQLRRKSTRALTVIRTIVVRLLLGYVATKKRYCEFHLLAIILVFIDRRSGFFVWSLKGNQTYFHFERSVALRNSCHHLTIEVSRYWDARFRWLIPQ